MALGVVLVAQVAVELEEFFVTAVVDQSAACFAVVVIASCGGCRATNCDWNCLENLFKNLSF